MRRRLKINAHRIAVVTAWFAGILIGHLASSSDAFGQFDHASSTPPSLESYQPRPGRDRGYSDSTVAGDAEAIFWSKNEFTIPFHVDAAGKQPAEVQLEISNDGGNTWSLYARDSLQSRQFRFASHQDGLYLFRIKTIDESGQTYDPGGLPLKVVVDTQIPELSLTIDTDTQGRMVASFTVSDANPRIDSLRLEFQTEQSNRWTSIAYETERPKNDVVSGRGMWEIPASARQLVVRLIAKDAAGNEAEITRLPLLPKTASGLGGLTLASGVPAPRFGQSYNNTQNTAPQLANQTPLNSSPPTAPASTTFGKPYAGPPPSSRTAQPKTQPTPAIPVPSASMASSSSRYPLQTLPSETTLPPSNANNEEALYLDPSATAKGKGIETFKQNSRAQPPLGTTQSLEDKPFYSKSRAFSLDYEVDGQTASPVASVELWGTADGGKLWERWGTDPDGVSPFDIKVETDGLFGFRMVVVGANGLAGNRPRNGDNADAWIQVDTERPTARITSALYGKGVEANSLVVEFSAQDVYFGERPITLSYSEIPAGPWTTITNGLKNSGRFVWPADPTLPRRVYLKLEAFDEAGNLGEHILDVPVDIEGLAPRGRIQGFRPISQ